MDNCLLCGLNHSSLVLFQLLAILITPLLTILLSRHVKTVSFLSPIVLCFAVGILIRNLNLISVNEVLCNWVRDISILVALPLLLFSSDVKSWLKQSKSLLIGYAIAVVSGLCAIGISAFTFQQLIKQIWIPSGMMAGIHTGGTPNLFAVGLAMEAEAEVFTLTNSAQILWGAIYLLFILSIAQRFFGYFLTKYDFNNSTETNNPSDTSNYVDYHNISMADSFKAIGIVCLVIALCVGISQLIFGSLKPTLIIILVTTIGIICSLNTTVRNFKGPFEIGDYLLLMFGVAVGLTSDFRELLTAGGQYIYFVGIIFILTIIIQILISKIFKIDRDTLIVSSTAAIYGPVFIPQVTRALKNKSLLVGGITISLIGLAIGNYVGIGLAYVLSYLMS